MIIFLQVMVMIVANSSSTRDYTWFDSFLIKADTCLRSLHDTLAPSSQRVSPAANIDETPLSTVERKLSASLMRVNHTGEVCAQALYLGQSLTARKTHLAETLREAAKEEVDHLVWCENRINELNGHKSYLNPLWFIGSFALGSFAGIIGDKWSLGFLAETENQVYNHLGSHLNKLPLEDHKSRAIILTMQTEEQQHAATATNLGAAVLPAPIKFCMRFTSTIMTTVAYYI